MADNGIRIPKLTSPGSGAPRRLETLPLSSVDGYVMSRIDGATNERDLAASTGLTEESINDTLGKLEFLGLIEYVAAPPVTPTPAFTAESRTSPSLRTQRAEPRSSAPQNASPRRNPPASMPPRAQSNAPSRPPPYDPRELDEDVEIEREHRKKILELYARLDGTDHYQILGVARTADKKSIKRAYFELATLFHPDRYFRKRLGTYKMKMEACFGRLTQAHEILTSKQRPEYDEYLGIVAVTQQLETGIAAAQALELKLVAEANAQDAQLVLVREKVELQLVAAVKAPEPRGIEDLLQDALAAMAPAVEKSDPARPLSMMPPAVGGFGEVGPSTPFPPPAPRAAPSSPGGSPATYPPPARAPSPSSAPGGGAGPSTRLPPPLLSPNAQREAFARRLLGPAKAPPRPPQPNQGRSAAASTPSYHQMSVNDAMDALRRRYRERIGDARKSQAQKHADSAAQAMQANDPVAAANAYRLAITLMPEDEALRQAFEEAQSKADVILSENYLRQATYEEKNENWSEAAKSWSKVAKARPTEAKAFERAAHARVRANGDMHEASTLASRAVALEPMNADYKVTLANVYMAAGLPKNARRELEAAVKLSPDDANIQTLLKRAQKGV